MRYFAFGAYPSLDTFRAGWEWEKGVQVYVPRPSNTAQEDAGKAVVAEL